MSSETPQISRFEWDFKSCPEEELKTCLYYEYSREIQEWREQIQEFKSGEGILRHQSPARALEYFQKHGFSPYPKTPFEFAIRYPHLKLPIFFEEWPETPWLEISKERRKEWFQEKNQYKWTDIYGSVDSLREGGNIQPHVHKEENGHKVSYGIFKIDWDLSDPDLHKQFDVWLKTWRNQNPVEKRGKTSELEILKRLGAYRLMRHFPKYKDAASHALRILSCEFYSDQQGWLKAKRQALKDLKAFEKSRGVESLLAVKKGVR